MAGGINLYAYVGNDPVNMVDPLGLQDSGPPIVVIGPLMRAIMGGGKLGSLPTASISPNAGFNTEPTSNPPITVTAKRLRPKKPSYCGNRNYMRGQELKNAGEATKVVGATVLAYGGLEALFFGSMTEGAGAVLATPMLGKGAALYGWGSIASLGGSLLQCRAGSGAACKQFVAGGILQAMSAAAAPGPAGDVITDLIGDIATNAANEAEPCK